MKLAAARNWIGFGAAIAIAVTATSAGAKECFAPDARAQERAFSRAVITEGGKTLWLGGQTGTPTANFRGPDAGDLFRARQEHQGGRRQRA